MKKQEETFGRRFRRGQETRAEHTRGRETRVEHTNHNDQRLFKVALTLLREDRRLQLGV